MRLPPVKVLSDVIAGRACGLELASIRSNLREGHGLFRTSTNYSVCRKASPRQIALPCGEVTAEMTILSLPCSSSAPDHIFRSEGLVQVVCVPRNEVRPSGLAAGSFRWRPPIRDNRHVIWRQRVLVKQDYHGTIRCRARLMLEEVPGSVGGGLDSSAWRCLSLGTVFYADHNEDVVRAKASCLCCGARAPDDLIVQGILRVSRLGTNPPCASKGSAEIWNYMELTNLHSLRPEILRAVSWTPYSDDEARAFLRDRIPEAIRPRKGSRRLAFKMQRVDSTPATKTTARPRRCHRGYRYARTSTGGRLIRCFAPWWFPSLRCLAGHRPPSVRRRN